MRPIDADALVDMLQGFEDKLDKKAFREVDVKYAYIAGVIQEIKNRVKDVPTLDYEPVRHGEWIMKSDDNSFGVCSWCNRSDHIDPLATHCRYCGAKMDGGKDDG